MEADHSEVRSNYWVKVEKEAGRAAGLRVDAVKPLPRQNVDALSHTTPAAPGTSIPPGRPTLPPTAPDESEREGVALKASAPLKPAISLLKIRSIERSTRRNLGGGVHRGTVSQSRRGERRRGWLTAGAWLVKGWSPSDKGIRSSRDRGRPARDGGHAVQLGGKERFMHFPFKTDKNESDRKVTGEALETERSKTKTATLEGSERTVDGPTRSASMSQVLDTCRLFIVSSCKAFP